MRTAIVSIIFLVSTRLLYAQESPKCGCPPIKMYVYDTKVDFQPDSTFSVVDAGKYAEARFSGDWLEGAYQKQRSTQFEVYKGFVGYIRGDKKVHILQLPPSDGSVPPGDDIDFVSYAEVSRSGDPGAYTYTVTVTITDAHTGSTVITPSQTTSDLGDVDSLIDVLTDSFSPVPDRLRDYQKKLRDESGGTKWIGAKWRTTADKTRLRIDETTKIHIKAFDCLDEKPIPNQQISVKLTDDNVGSVTPAQVTTDASGEATVIFRAKNNGEIRAIANFKFTNVRNKTGNATSCSDQEDIDVIDNLYQLTADFNAVGPDGTNYHFIGECKVYLKALDDGTSMLAPLDKSRQMDLTIEKAALTSHSIFEGPNRYKIPFLFTTDKRDPKHPGPLNATFALNTVCPQSGKVEWTFTAGGHKVKYTCDIDKGILTYLPGGPVPVTGAVGKPYAMDASTDLDILQYFGEQQVLNNTGENLGKSNDLLIFMRRMQAHQHDPAYFNTPQGKADMQRMSAFQRQSGSDGNMPKNFKQAALYNLANKDIPPANSANRARMLPGTARIRVKGAFNSETNDIAFDSVTEGSVGPLKASIKVTVQKLQ